MQSTQNRRRFLATLSSAGAAGLIGAPALAQQAPPETTTIRLAKYSSICVAPYSAADELLRSEGFTDIRYVPMDAESGVPSRHSPAARSTS
jgi:NitT/TauT family transport system substrate-binding protein